MSIHSRFGTQLEVDIDELQKHTWTNLVCVMAGMITACMSMTLPSLSKQ